MIEILCLSVLLIHHIILIYWLKLISISKNFILASHHIKLIWNDLILLHKIMLWMSHLILIVLLSS